MNATGTKPANFTLSIAGMTCGHCVQAVTEALSAMPGVAVRSVAVGSTRITATDGLTVARAIAALKDACGGAATSVAPQGRERCG